MEKKWEPGFNFIFHNIKEYNNKNTKRERMDNMLYKLANNTKRGSARKWGRKIVNDLNEGVSKAYLCQKYGLSVEADQPLDYINVHGVELAAELVGNKVIIYQGK